MKYPCADCVFLELWVDDEGANRGCTHPLVYKTPAMCPSMMNYNIKNRLNEEEVEE